ncbi:MAG TPA: hypothetical protein VLF39_03680 [Candidatus Saccharimonadales bacterium]|nr:hypothetical protein [Candidatus Saccharimonadales bacterium]
MSENTGVGTPIKNNPIVSLLKSRRYWGWVIVICIIVVLLILALLIQDSHRPKKLVKIAPCSDQILQEAAPNLDTTKVTELSKVVDKITAIPNYQSDVNCMYVVTDFYVNLSDIDNADKSLTVLKRLYKLTSNAQSDTDNLSPLLKTNTGSVKGLETSLAALKSMKSNTPGGGSAYAVDENGKIIPIGGKK